jgi:hypothetical protein
MFYLKSSMFGNTSSDEDHDHEQAAVIRRVPQEMQACPK